VEGRAGGAFRDDQRDGQRGDVNVEHQSVHAAVEGQNKRVRTVLVQGNRPDTGHVDVEVDEYPPGDGVAHAVHGPFAVRRIHVSFRAEGRGRARQAGAVHGRDNDHMTTTTSFVS